jgi:hypothetical protein
VRFDAPEAGRRQRLVPALIVLGAHALLLSLWLRDRGPLQAPDREAEPVAWLRLLQPTVPVDRPPETAATGPRGPRGGARTAATLAITPQPAAVSRAAPTAAEPPSAAAASTPLPAWPHTAAPPQASLDLSLPRQPNAPWRDRNPALDDPRSNTRPPAAVEARIAAALGDGRWHVERLDNDRVRFRSGSRCVIATRSRAGQIELAGGAFRDLWAVSDC